MKIKIYVYYGIIPEDIGISGISSSKELQNFLDDVRENDRLNTVYGGVTFHTLDTWFFQSEYAEIADVYLVYNKDKIISLNDMLNHKEQPSVKSKRNWRPGHNFMKLLHNGEFDND